jgi:hypothetical protein
MTRYEKLATDFARQNHIDIDDHGDALDAWAPPGKVFGNGCHTIVVSYAPPSCDPPDALTPSKRWETFYKELIQMQDSTCDHFCDYCRGEEDEEVV